MISDIFTEIGNVVTAFTTALSSSVSGITSMFYVPGDDGGLTVLGTLVLIGVGVGLVYWAFRLIRNLLKRA